jgi:chemotaxis regulatin CheY-phosphate phosphatase CheZ
MSARGTASSSPPRRPGCRADAAAYRETVQLLVSVSERHREALRELAVAAVAPRAANGIPGSTDQLGERVGQLEDAAVRALARLARTSDYEDALEAMHESGSLAWLWGTILNRAAEATDAARVSRKR